MSTRLRPTTTVARTAQILRGYLNRRHVKAPALMTLSTLLDTAFLASLRTEESRPTVCTLAYAPPTREGRGDGPSEESGDDPASVARARAFRFEAPIPLTVRNLVKLAPAANPATTTVLVHAAPKPGGKKKGRAGDAESAGPGGLVIWGLADQPAPEWRAGAAEGDRGGAARPGLFQVEITGVATLAVFDGRTQIAELRQDAIASVFPDVLREGEVHDGLEPYFDFGALPAGVDPLAAELVPLLRVEYSAAVVARVLARVQRSGETGGHGGALLFARKTAGLTVKHAIDCSRLREAVDGQLRATGSYMDASYRIAREFIDAGKEHVPMVLYQDQLLGRSRLDAFDQAVAGAVGFVASLTRIDGLVLIGPRFQVRGFGVEITAGPGAADPPAEAVVAADRAAVGGAEEREHSRHLRPLDLNQFGTRHRSMIRHCWRDPEAVGFVVSQDGEARAVRRVGDRVVVWESIKIRAVEQQLVGSGQVVEEPAGRRRGRRGS